MIGSRISFNWPLFLFLLLGCGCQEQSAFIGQADDYSALKDTSPEPSACSESPRELFNNRHTPFRGGDVRVSIEVNIVEDFRCPYCIIYSHFLNDLWQRRTDFHQSVRLYFHHFPLEELHPGTTEIHVAAVAAAEQEGSYFWALYDEIAEKGYQGNELQIDDVERFLAKQSGFDEDRFRAERRSAETKNFVQWDKRQSRGAGVQGTPTVFVCTEEIDRSSIEERIDELLADTE